MGIDGVEEVRGDVGKWRLREVGAWRFLVAVEAYRLRAPEGGESMCNFLWRSSYALPYWYQSLSLSLGRSRTLFYGFIILMSRRRKSVRYGNE